MDAAGIWETSRKHGAQVTDVQGAETALRIDYPLMSTSERCKDTGPQRVRDARSKRICTTGDYRRISRWQHEEVLEAMQARLDQMPQASRIRRQTVEHVFSTLKAWMGTTHFLMKRLRNVSTAMGLHVLAYNLKRAMQILGVVPLLQAMRA
jgi:hypothetical protein